MKSRTFTIAAMLLAVSAASAPSYGASLKDVNRPIYGYFNSEVSFGEEYGIAEIQTGDLTTPKMLYSFPEHGVHPSYAGTGYDGILYAFTYVWNGSLAPMNPSDLIAYNLYTGRVTTIGQWAPSDSYLKPQDATYDASTGTLYVMAYENGQSMLMKANMETGALEKVLNVQASMSFFTLAAGPGGQLYTIGTDGVLYRLSKTTGALTKVMETGMAGFMFMQSMEFDPTTGHLIWAMNASNFDPDDVNLMEIDLSNPDDPTIDYISTLGNNAVFTGLYIPGASSYDAPAAPAALKAEYVKGKLEANLSWINPTTTFGNEELAAADMNGMVIFRNGERLAVLSDATPGKEMTYTDTTIPTDGEYRYDVFAISTGGSGMKGTAFAYIGADAPKAVANPTVEGAEAYTSAVISWDPVTEGLHAGDFDPSSVRYKVIRRPDNKVIAEDMTETMVTDNDIRRTLSYYYDVISFNTVGEADAVSTPNLILGPAIDTPFVEEFDSDRETLNRWLVTDANHDYNTWMFNSTAGSTFFGDYETALEYMVSPASGGPYNDADEWIVSGPLKFEAGKQYQLVLAVRSIAPEKLEIAFGTSEDPDQLTICGTLDIKVSEYIEGEPNVRANGYKIDLPTEGIAIGNVGMHLCTPLNDLHYNFFQICTATICEKGTDSVENVELPAVMTRFHNGIFEIAGEFDGVRIFNAAGATVASGTERSFDLSSAAPGVYVAVISTPAGKNTVKFVK